MLKTIQTPEQLDAFLQTDTTLIDPEMMASVMYILESVRKEGDKAVRDYTSRFDHIDLDELEVSSKELEEQAAKADAAFVQALEQAADNIKDFHELQKQNGYELEKEQARLGVRVLPLKRVGLYVPGGRAQYPSSVLMNAIPARIAGVEQIVMVTPPDKEGKLPPNLAAAAKVAGVDRIFKVGGAQAIAALAYGTESIPAVDKIVGPGNAYVANAKRLVFGIVDIDMIAGPSEILVLADGRANPAFAAADLLSQAEHDPQARPILVTTDGELIEKVNKELERQLQDLPKKEIATKALEEHGAAILAGSLDEAVAIANRIAPEHLEIQTENPFELLDEIVNAGSVFVGDYSCESLGDYFAGVNHVLPTSGTARFSSPLSVDSFIKKSSYCYYPKEKLQQEVERIALLARNEDLESHARALEVRL